MNYTVFSASRVRLSLVGMANRFTRPVNDNVLGYKPGEALIVCEPWSPDHAAFYPNFPIVFKSDFSSDCLDVRDGKVFSPESNSWHRFEWCPAMVMPKDKHQMKIEIVSTFRANLLDSIDNSNCASEGVLPCLMPKGKGYRYCEASLNSRRQIVASQPRKTFDKSVEAFLYFWDQRFGKQFPSSNNPLVDVYYYRTFSRTENGYSEVLCRV